MSLYHIPVVGVEPGLSGCTFYLSQIEPSDTAKLLRYGDKVRIRFANQSEEGSSYVFLGRVLDQRGSVLAFGFASLSTGEVHYFNREVLYSAAGSLAVQSTTDSLIVRHDSDSRPICLASAAYACLMQLYAEGVRNDLTSRMALASERERLLSDLVGSIYPISKVGSFDSLKLELVMSGIVIQDIPWQAGESAVPQLMAELDRGNMAIVAYTTQGSSYDVAALWADHRGTFSVGSRLPKPAPPDYSKVGHAIFAIGTVDLGKLGKRILIQDPRSDIPAQLIRPEDLFPEVGQNTSTTQVRALVVSRSESRRTRIFQPNGLLTERRFLYFVDGEVPFNKPTQADTKFGEPDNWGSWVIVQHLSDTSSEMKTVVGYLLHESYRTLAVLNDVSGEVSIINKNDVPSASYKVDEGHPPLRYLELFAEFRRQKDRVLRETLLAGQTPYALVRLSPGDVTETRFGKLYGNQPRFVFGRVEMNELVSGYRVISIVEKGGKKHHLDSDGLDESQIFLVKDADTIKHLEKMVSVESIQNVNHSTVQIATSNKDIYKSEESKLIPLEFDKSVKQLMFDKNQPISILDYLVVDLLSNDGKNGDTLRGRVLRIFGSKILIRDERVVSKSDDSADTWIDLSRDPINAVRGVRSMPTWSRHSGPKSSLVSNISALMDPYVTLIVHERDSTTVFQGKAKVLNTEDGGIVFDIENRSGRHYQIDPEYYVEHFKAKPASFDVLYFDARGVPYTSNLDDYGQPLRAFKKVY